MSATTDKILTLKDAGQRLSWRFSQGKEFRPNQNDVDALKMLLKTINQTQSKTIQDNLLFAKLFIIIVNDLAKIHNSVDIANQKVNRMLQIPIVTLCERMKINLNRIELNRMVEEKETVSGAEFLETVETWDLDNVTANMNTAINQAINNYKNLP